MKSKLSTDGNIYILAPAGVATGGPELLHQLAYKLINQLGYKNVFMVYLPIGKIENPIHKEYLQYNIPYVNNIEDNEKNLLIAPEVYTGYLNKFRKINKSIWWLSVDNYYFNNGFIIGIINKLLLRLFNTQKYILFNKKLNNINIHLVQSEYAKSHLIKKGIYEEKILFLSDYLNIDFLNINTDLSKKENIIAYNPKKGFKFTRKLIEYIKNIEKDHTFEFVPIQNMTRKDVISLLQKSKVYIDFGYFPGKDRIPREAVILGNCILISKMGSGGYQEDFPILDRYKIDDLTNYQKIYVDIKNIISSYDLNINDFDNYVNIIKKEESVFDKQLEKTFII